MAATPEARDANGRDEQPQNYIRWVPVVVPLFALLLATLVYLIGAEVL